jgi:hypothetical protein
MISVNLQLQSENNWLVLLPLLQRLSIQYQIDRQVDDKIIQAQQYIMGYDDGRVITDTLAWQIREREDRNIL